MRRRAAAGAGAPGAEAPAAAAALRRRRRGPDGSTPARQRRVERSTRLELTTTDVQTAGDGVVRATQAAGGFVQSSQIATGDGHSTASFVLRVPTSRLDDALARLSRLGHVKSLQQSADDITNAYNGASARLAEARAERRGLLRALSKATTAQEISSLRARIADNRRALQRYERQLDAVRNRANYATVGVEVTGVAAQARRRPWRRVVDARRRRARRRPRPRGQRRRGPRSPSPSSSRSGSSARRAASPPPRCAAAVARRRCRPDGKHPQKLQPRNSSRRGPFKARAGDRDSPPSRHISMLAPSTAKFAGYRVEGIAGRGGMGVVYKATQLGLDRPVALKVVAAGLLGDPRIRERFLRESRAAAAIEHPNVIPIHDYGECRRTGVHRHAVRRRRRSARAGHRHRAARAGARGGDRGPCRRRARRRARCRARPPRRQAREHPARRPRPGLPQRLRPREPRALRRRADLARRLGRDDGLHGARADPRRARRPARRHLRARTACCTSR